MEAGNIHPFIRNNIFKVVELENIVEVTPMQTNELSGQGHRRKVLFLSTALAFVLIISVIQLLMVRSVEADAGRAVNQDGGGETDVITGTEDALQRYMEAHLLPAAESSLLAADLGGSAKLVDQEEATAGSTLHYTIVISNSGDDFTSAMITDTLPPELTLIPGSLSADGGLDPQIIGGNVITWAGALLGGQEFNVTFDAVLTDTLAPDDIVTNTVEITGTGSLITRVAETIITAGSPADLSGSSKGVDRASATPESVLAYTITLGNSGEQATTAEMTDTLPAELTYVPGTLSVTPDIGAYDDTNDIITWSGTITGGADVTINFDAQLAATVAPDDMVTNTAEITGTGQLITRSAATQIVEAAPVTTTMYLPAIFESVPTVTGIQVSRPDGDNQWTVSWTAVGAAGATYELQESHDPDFATVLKTYETGTNSSQLIDHDPSINNVYYYRVRAQAGDFLGSWSEVDFVIGGYRDDFTTKDGGWEIRRTTYIEEVRSFYEIEDGKDWFVIQVEDSWDWGIAAPKALAPSIPYVIEYASKFASTGNLVSHGAVFGGDWPGAICPDKSSADGWYKHDLCFNHFYNTNTIFYGPLKMLFERVDRLVWCADDPNCVGGGSPLKRGADTKIIDPIPNVEAEDWNTWRIEVRASGIRMFANGELFLTYDDARYVTEPYFGVFASTDEYSNSTARFEYYQVLPLDN